MKQIDAHVPGHGNSDPGGVCTMLALGPPWERAQKLTAMLKNPHRPRSAHWMLATDCCSGEPRTANSCSHEQATPPNSYETCVGTGGSIPPDGYSKMARPAASRCRPSSNKVSLAVLPSRTWWCIRCSHGEGSPSRPFVLAMWILFF